VAKQNIVFRISGFHSGGYLRNHIIYSEVLWNIVALAPPSPYIQVSKLSGAELFLRS
jgi:hypothetical protein